MARAAKSTDLLYVSDYQTNDVYAYSYPGGKLNGVLKGVLKDFPLQSGLCSDAQGNVFIPDSSNSSVLVYAHGGTKLLRQLLDPNQYPYTCAVDPASGTVAVVNLESISGAGSVSLYAQGKGRPKIYNYGFVYKYYFGSFDSRGNLFVDASYDIASEPFAFLELPKGARSMQAIMLKQTFNVPGGVGWDGKHVVVGDSKTSELYQFDVSGSTGTETGSTRLGKGRFVTQFFIDGNSATGANFNGHNVAFWKYPAGGLPSKAIRGLGYPFGVALSKAPH
jgi:hypothetical protein